MRSHRRRRWFLPGESGGTIAAFVPYDRSLRERIRHMWAIFRGRVPDYGAFEEEPPGPGDGPQKHEALVPIGPPRKPRPSSAVALPVPDPDPESVDVVGRDLNEDEPGANADALTG